MWNGRIVAESTLTSHINAARKAIGDSGQEQRLIRTIARKGFRFVGDVSEGQPSVGLSSATAGAGGVVTWNRVRIGCANARSKGTCSNKATIRRDHLEATVLGGLQHHPPEAALMEEFCDVYTRQLNELSATERNRHPIGPPYCPPLPDRRG